jgi:tRNA(Ile)-lysidine synthase
MKVFIIVYMNFLEYKILEKLNTFKNIKRFVIAYSGGVDSTVLLNIIHAIRYNLTQRIHIFHVNHQIQNDASGWQLFCKQQAQELNIPFSSFVAKIPKSDIKQYGLEGAARKVRYQIFIDNLLNTDLLLFAHHLNDNNETFLLRLLRGAGLSGLSAMPEKRSIGNAQLYRPLLDVDKSCIMDYAKSHQLQWITDTSNDDITIDRNYLRIKVIPDLQKHWPQLAKQINTTSNICNDSYLELHRQAQNILKEIASGKKLNINHLLKLSLTMQTYTLRAWLDNHYLATPSYLQTHTFLKNLANVKQDTKLQLSYADVKLLVYKNYVYILNVNYQPDNTIYHWNFTTTLRCKNGSYSSVKKFNAGININDIVTVCFRKQAKHSRKSIKNIMQDKQIPYWQRDYIPLIFYKNKLVAVSDLWFNQAFVVKSSDNKDGWIISWDSDINYSK